MTGLEDRPVGLAIAAVGLATGTAALSIGGWGGGAWGPRTVPLLASLTMIAAGSAIAFSARRARPSGVAGADPRPNASSSGDLRVAWYLGLAVVYVLAIDRVGYLLATALATPPAFSLFGVRRPLALVLSALIVPLALHLAFFRVLGVFPPLGRWFDLLDHLPL